MKFKKLGLLLTLSAAMIMAGCNGSGADSSSSSSSEVASSSASSSSSSSINSSSSETSSSASSSSSSSSSSEASSSYESSSSSEESSSEVSSSSEESSSSESSSSSEEVAEKFALVAEGGEHMNVQFFNDEGYLITEAEAFDTVYIGISATDSDYGVIKLTATYQKQGDFSRITDDITDQISEEQSGRYYFQLPNLSSGTSVTFTITERNLHAFADYAFVGSYLGVDISNSSAKNITSFSSSLAFTIDEAGDVTFTNNSNRSAAISSATATSGRGTFYTTDYVTVDYTDRLIFFADYMEKSLSQSSFWYFGVQKENASDPNSSYTIDCQTYAVDGTRYIAMRAFKDGELYVSAYIEGASSGSPTIHFGATFNMIYGDNLSDDKSIYEVYDGDSLLHVVGYKLSGGYNNRFFISGPYGNYADEVNNKTLFLDGNGNATYDDASFLYDIGEDGASITLTSGTRSITGTIDSTNKTFTVLTDEEIEGSAAFIGHAYRGSFVDGWGEDTLYFYIIFDESESTFSSVTGYSSTITMESKGYSYYMENNDAEYSYDASTMVITIPSFNNYGTYVAMSMTYNPTSDTITITTNYSSYYATAGTVLSKVS